mgnify:CR=1 FL=1
MLQLLDEYEESAAGRARLQSALSQHASVVLASRGRGDLQQVARAEAEVRADPRRMVFNESGVATLYACGRAYQAGRFEAPRLCELRARAQATRARAKDPQVRCRLFVLDGAGPQTDIGALQADAPPGTLFQVASQFNCLESPGSYITEVADYVHDPTQGPRASLSAFPGALLRHYAAALSEQEPARFTQKDEGPQLNLIAAVCEPAIAAVHSGYLRAASVRDPVALARALEERHDELRVGVHDGIEVVLGYDWAGAVAAAPHRTVAQVLTSTIAAGMYGDLGAAASAQVGLSLCRSLLRAAYLGTLLAAAALGKERAVLTLIGGGVFGNPVPLIWETILWALEQVEVVTPLLHRDLMVVVNGRNLGEEVPLEALQRAVQARYGALVRFERSGAAQIAR